MGGDKKTVSARSGLIIAYVPLENKKKCGSEAERRVFI
jgi:hypothetical protein